MQATFYPLHILSRIAAVCVVALPLAWLHLAVDDYEREAIRKMTHQQLIAFVQEGHSASFLGAYLPVAIVTLFLVAAVEAVALGIRFTVGVLAAKKSVPFREEELATARADDWR
jgi:hypothetical protein